MSEKLLTRFGYRARVFVYMFLHRGEWKTIYEIAKETHLSVTSVLAACNFLVKHFPRYFEEKDGKYRFKKIFERGK